jgi:hypothetical protein
MDTNLTPSNTMDNSIGQVVPFNDPYQEPTDLITAQAGGGQEGQMTPNYPLFEGESCLPTHFSSNCIECQQPACIDCDDTYCDNCEQTIHHKCLEQHGTDCLEAESFSTDYEPDTYCDTGCGKKWVCGECERCAACCDCRSHGFTPQYQEAETFEATEWWNRQTPTGHEKASGDHGGFWIRTDYDIATIKEIFKDWKPKSHPYEKRITQDTFGHYCSTCGKIEDEDNYVHYQFYLPQSNSRHNRMRYVSGGYCTNSKCGSDLCENCIDSGGNKCEECGEIMCSDCAEDSQYRAGDSLCDECLPEEYEEESFGAESFASHALSLCGVCSVAGHQCDGQITGCPCCEITVKKESQRPTCGDCGELKSSTPQEYDQWTCWPCRNAAGGGYHGTECYCNSCMGYEEDYNADSKFKQPYDGSHGFDPKRDTKGRFRRKLVIPLAKGAESFSADKKYGEKGMKDGDDWYSIYSFFSDAKGSSHFHPTDDYGIEHNLLGGTHGARTEREAIEICKTISKEEPGAIFIVVPTKWGEGFYDDADFSNPTAMIYDGKAFHYTVRLGAESFSAEETEGARCMRRLDEMIDSMQEYADEYLTHYPVDGYSTQYPDMKVVLPSDEHEDYTEVAGGMVESTDAQVLAANMVLWAMEMRDMSEDLGSNIEYDAESFAAEEEEYDILWEKVEEALHKHLESQIQKGKSIDTIVENTPPYAIVEEVIPHYHECYAALIGDVEAMLSETDWEEVHSAEGNLKDYNPITMLVLGIIGGIGVALGAQSLVK